jgi:hypothetical protein
MRQAHALLLAVALLAPVGARAGDPARVPSPAQPGNSEFSLSPPPAPPKPVGVGTERRALEMERVLDDAQRDQRQRAEERAIEELGDRQALEEYQIRERRADDTRALEEDLDRRALESKQSGAAAPGEPKREIERALQSEELEKRSGQVDDRIRARERVTPRVPGTKP